MGRELGFLEYNMDNILTNLIQAEDHLRVLYGKDHDEKGHNSCVRKHLMFVSGEAGEAISHTSHTDPGQTPEFRRIKSDTDALKENLDDTNVGDAIVRVRNIRKAAEKLDPKYDTSKCKACSLHGDSWSEKNNKHLNTNYANYNHKDLGVNSMTRKEFTKQMLTFNGGQFIGKGIADVVAPMIDATVTPGADLPFRASTWVNILGGLALQLGGNKYLKGNAQLGAVIAGSHMVSKIINYAMESAVVPPTAVRARMISQPITGAGMPGRTSAPAVF